MERQLPKNVRQIGNVCDEPKIYVEDYVDTFLGQLQERAMEKPVAAALVGEITKCEDKVVVYISGAIQAEDVEVEGTNLKISEEIWEKIEKEQKEYFKDQKLIGWCLLETGHPMSMNRGAQELHRKMYDQENTIFIWKDASSSDEMYFAYKYNELMQIGGHYIYYEKNHDKFKLHSAIIKGLFLKVPENSPQIVRLKKWYKSNTPEAVENIEKYGLHNAVIYEYFYDKWVSFDEVMDNIPYSVEREADFLRTHKNIELNHKGYWYFLNISDYQLKGEQMPFDFAKAQIREILMNQKKMNFLKEVKDELYQDALKEKEIEYFN